MRGLVPVLALMAAACRSSAPYTLPSAVVNTAIAAGVSAQRRAEGACFAVCTNGTACNPRTGFCEPAACGGKCQAWETCVETETGLGHCVASSSPAISERQRDRADLPGGFTPGLGVSPATGTVPTLPPEKASPEKP